MPWDVLWVGALWDVTVGMHRRCETAGEGVGQWWDETPGFIQRGGNTRGVMGSDRCGIRLWDVGRGMWGVGCGTWEAGSGAPRAWRQSVYATEMRPPETVYSQIAAVVIQIPGIGSRPKMNAMIRPEPTRLPPRRQQNETIARTAVHATVFQVIASVLVPSLIIHQASRRLRAP